MVKPSKSMEPESVDMTKLEKKGTRGMDGDSFRNYMTRKIDLQRKQIGLVLPPSPQRRVRFADDFSDESVKDMPSLLQRLEKRHGTSKKRKRRPSSNEESSHSQEDQFVAKRALEESDSIQTHQKSPRQRHRPDLFFQGVVVLVNGYTEPDNDTLMRLLHKHGGDLEKYETTRCTHIIAQNLSAAKASMYKRQRKPKPVVQPRWIVDSCKAGRLLPHGDYLIEQMRPEATSSVKQFLKKSPRQEETKGDISGHGNTAVTIDSLQTLASKNSDDGGHACSSLEVGGCHDGGKVQAGSSVASVVSDDTPSTGEKAACPNESKGNEVTRRESEESFDTTTTCLGEAQRVSSDKDGTHLERDKVHGEFSVASVASDSAPSSGRKAEGHVEARESGERVQEPTSRPCLSEAKGVSSDEPIVDASEQRSNESGKKGSVASSKPVGTTFSNGKTRTVGTDKDFLESFFHSSRLSFIGSFKQRTKNSPTKKVAKQTKATQRFVFLIDMDCFFASVVLRKFPQYRDKPVAISHMGKAGGNPAQLETKDSTSECATCNYHARKYGIKKGMYLGRARELCPDLVVLHYDFEGYEEVSEKVADIVQRLADEHGGNVEQVSCDESYMELFLSTKEDTPNEVAQNIANEIRSEIFETTQCTATVGVAPNKFLAKLAADKVKPNKSMVVREYRTLLEPLKLRELHGVGYRMEQKLLEENLVFVRDVWELGDHAQGELTRILGPGLGKKIFLFCQGQDDRLVKPMERKTIGAECNYGVRFDGPYGVDHMVIGLAKEVEKRMVGVGVKGSRVTLKIKQRKQGAKPPPKFLGHGSCHNLSKSMDTSGGAPTQDWSAISRIGMTLLKELSVPKDDIRGMGIVVSKLVSEKASTVDDSAPTSGRITSWFGEAASKPSAPLQLHQSAKEAGDGDTEHDFHESTATVVTYRGMEGSAGAHEDDSVKGVRLFDNEPDSFATAALSQVDTNGHPTLSQVDRKVLENLPADIRMEVEGEIARARTPIGAGTDSISAPASNNSHESTIVLENSDRSVASPQSGSVHSSDAFLDDDDLALPSFSQIHMSQVAELPSPLKKQIVSKIMSESDTVHHTGEEKEEAIEESTVDVDLDSEPRGRGREKGESGVDVPMRQLDLKRMLKLAAVKSGQDTTLSETQGGSVSLTQLECLPLEMQLQVVNNEEIVPRRPSSVTTGRRRSSPESKHTSSISRNATTKQAARADDDEVIMEVETPDTAYLESKQPSFYQENVAPLKKWMDEHSDASDSAANQVREFLCICVTEKRLCDATKLLRSMKNRGDEWSGSVYQDILEAVNERALAVLGRSLDLKGLGL